MSARAKERSNERVPRHRRCRRSVVPPTPPPSNASALTAQMAKATTAITRLIGAYQEELVSLDELRTRMPELRARETSLRHQLDALDSQLADREVYLKLADNLQDFLTGLRDKATTATVPERQRVLRLLVKDVLVGPTTRHPDWLGHSCAPSCSVRCVVGAVGPVPPRSHKKRKTAGSSVAPARKNQIERVGVAAMMTTSLLGCCCSASGGPPLVVGASRGGIPLDDLGQEPGGVVLDLDADALDPAQGLPVQVGVVVSGLGLEDGADRCERAAAPRSGRVDGAVADRTAATCPGECHEGAELQDEHTADARRRRPRLVDGVGQVTFHDGQPDGARTPGRPVSDDGVSLCALAALQEGGQVGHVVHRVDATRAARRWRAVGGVAVACRDVNGIPGRTAVRTG